MQMAGIPRSETVIWNTGLGWDRDFSNSARSARRDAVLPSGFIGALPRLEVVVQVGSVARRYARRLVAERGLISVETVHPSPGRRVSVAPAQLGVPRYIEQRDTSRARMADGGQARPIYGTKARESSVRQPERP